MPAIDRAQLPAKFALGAELIPKGRLGGEVIWPLATPPSSSGIAVHNLLGSVRVAAAAPVTVDWGDGITEVLTPDGHGEAWGTHPYATPGVRTVRLSGGTTQRKKINAGTVPAGPITLIHIADPNTLDLPEIFQRDAAGHAAGAAYAADITDPASGAVYPPTTPFCDGVFRAHFFLDLVDIGTGTIDVASSRALLSLDVSYQGQWFDVSGSAGVLTVSPAIAQNKTTGTWVLWGQRYMAAMRTARDAMLAFQTNGQEPTTGKDWLDTSDTFSFTLVGTDQGKLISIYYGSDPATNGTGINSDDFPSDHGGTLPAGLDLEMMPAIF